MSSTSEAGTTTTEPGLESTGLCFGPHITFPLTLSLALEIFTPCGTGFEFGPALQTHCRPTVDSFQLKRDPLRYTTLSATNPAYTNHITSAFCTWKSPFNRIGCRVHIKAAAACSLTSHQVP